MILFRYLSKEVGITLIGLTCILVLIFMSNQVMIYMNRAATGIIPGVLVMKLMLLELPNLLSLLLPLGFYFALLLAYGRLYADSEMTVLQSCGYGSFSLCKHTFILAIIVAAITAGMISLNPLIAFQRAKLLQTTGMQTIIQTIIPGRFRVLGNNQNQYIFFVDLMNPKHTKAKGVFIAKRVSLDGKPAWNILTAEQARSQIDKKTGETYLILSNGKQYQGQPGNAAYQMAAFGRYEARLPHENFISKPNTQTLPFKDLLPLRNPDVKKAAELQWRISIPLMVFSLGLVAIPLSRVNPRAGRFSKLLPAVVLAVLYANFMFITRDWVAAGRIPAWLGMWWVHGILICIGLGLLYRQRTQLR